MKNSKILRMIYSPLTAVTDVVKNPKYKGPIMILLLFVLANTCFFYIALSKTFLEDTSPDSSLRDEWTEVITSWSSNAIISTNDDHITGDYYGNKSIQFSISNKTTILSQLQDVEPINSLGNSYKQLSFRIKILSPTNVNINNASLLLNTSSQDFFSYDLTDSLNSVRSDVWTNISLPIGPESHNWLKSSAGANWSSITSVSLELSWPETSVSTLGFRLDGLFFHGVFQSLTNDLGYVLNFSLLAFTQFTVKWVLLAGLLYLISKPFGAQIVWRTLLIAVGFALITLFIQAILNSITYLASPPLYYSFDLIGGVPGESDVAYQRILDENWLITQFSNTIQLIIHVWTVSLCAMVMRELTSFSWTKNFIIASLAYFAALVIETILL